MTRTYLILAACFAMALWCSASMAKDTPKKEAARAMMLMTEDVNKKYFKGQQKVTCVTCHNGKPNPNKK